MIKEYKNIIVLSVAIIVVVASAVFVPRFFHYKKMTSTTAVVAPTPCLEGELFNTANGTPCPSSEKTTVAISSYAETLAKYNGKTVSIAAACAMSPQVLSLTKGTRFLLVNSDKNPVTFMYGTETITLKPLHYATRIAQTAQTVQCGAEKTTVTVQ